MLGDGSPRSVRLEFESLEQADLVTLEDRTVNVRQAVCSKERRRTGCGDAALTRGHNKRRLHAGTAGGVRATVDSIHHELNGTMKKLAAKAGIRAPAAATKAAMVS